MITAAQSKKDHPMNETLRGAMLILTLLLLVIWSIESWQAVVGWIVIIAPFVGFGLIAETIVQIQTWLYFRERR